MQPDCKTEDRRVEDSRCICLPNPQNFRALQAGAELNRVENMVALNLAAWHVKESRKLYLAAVGGQHSLKKNTKLGYLWVDAESPDQTLKRVGIDTVDWIKIDAEDAENEILQGLCGTLRRCKPHIIFESRTKQLFERARRYLEHEGYSCEKIAPDNYVAIPKR